MERISLGSERPSSRAVIIFSQQLYYADVSFDGEDIKVKTGKTPGTLPVRAKRILRKPKPSRKAGNLLRLALTIVFNKEDTLPLTEKRLREMLKDEPVGPDIFEDWKKKQH